ncbi:unnamed protein product [Arctia plantaginis]|uniref:Uncharacterized protein n=1 Tax=Arctia plantaginis TaxID=874455 RepID=A0A8S0YVP9_ARCPL|nr:unnamed protein product [Arctia plantaginis]CAB3257691.1 unnamed protein product [Arctia plantaginis]
MGWLQPLLVMCGDGTCCCMPQRSVIALISIISLLASVLDAMTNDTNTCWYQCQQTQVMEHVQSLRSLLVTLFQMANLLLLVASVVESAVLVQVYVWYTLGFVVMELMVTMMEFLYKFKMQSRSSFIEFIVEVSFLFVICRCLPLVDTYRKHLEDHI